MPKFLALRRPQPTDLLDGAYRVDLSRNCQIAALTATADQVRCFGKLIMSLPFLVVTIWSHEDTRSDTINLIVSSHF